MGSSHSIEFGNCVREDLEVFVGRPVSDAADALAKFKSLMLPSPAISHKHFKTIFPKANESCWNIFSNTDKADVYEILAGMVICARAPPGQKSRTCFQMFDFDGSGGLNMPETVIMLRSCCRGLCTMTAAKEPTVEEFEVLSQAAFQTADQCHDDNITFVEFNNWTRGSVCHDILKIKWTLGNPVHEEELTPQPPSRTKTTNQRTASPRKTKPKKSKYSKAEILSVQECFNEMDSDGQGTVSVAEFVQHLNAAGIVNGSSSSMFRTLDRDGNKALTLEEFFKELYPLATAGELKLFSEWTAVPEPTQKKAKKKGMSEEELSELFDLYDTDKSGTLAFSEVKDLLKCMDISKPSGDFFSTSEDQLHSFFRKADTDNDGTMGFQEFVELMQYEL